MEGILNYKFELPYKDRETEEPKIVFIPGPYYETEAEIEAERNRLYEQYFGNVDWSQFNEYGEPL